MFPRLLTAGLSVAFIVGAALAYPGVPASAGGRDTITVEKRTVVLLSIRPGDEGRELTVEIDGRRYTDLRRGTEFGRPRRFHVSTIQRDCAYFSYSKGHFVAAFGLCVD